MGYWKHGAREDVTYLVCWAGSGHHHQGHEAQNHECSHPMTEPTTFSTRTSETKMWSCNETHRNQVDHCLKPGMPS